MTYLSFLFSTAKGRADRAEHSANGAKPSAESFRTDDYYYTPTIIITLFIISP